MIIERPKLTRRIKESQKWVFLYGRRKTGKTFLVENSVPYDDYYFVNRNRTILDKNSNKVLSYETFTELFRRNLGDNRTVIVDEFHRLESGFLDTLHSMAKRGKLILITSTLHLGKKLLSSNSPILGLFNEIKVDIIDLSDVIAELRKYNLTKRELMELSIIAREPIAIDYLMLKSPMKTIRNVVLGSVHTVTSLVGEIFNEEDRTLSMIYSGIISAIAVGNTNSGKISSYLFSRKLIQKDDPSIIQAHMSNLVEIGILRKLKVFNKNRYSYRIASPLARLFYYASEKLGLSERNVPDKQIDEVIKLLFPRIVEDNVREFLAGKYGLNETIIEEKDYDVDGYLLHHKRPEIALEVKWTAKLDKIETIREKLISVGSRRHILFLQDKGDLQVSGIELMDPADLTP